MWFFARCVALGCDVLCFVFLCLVWGCGCVLGLCFVVLGLLFGNLVWDFWFGVFGLCVSFVSLCLRVFLFCLGLVYGLGFVALRRVALRCVVPCCVLRVRFLVFGLWLRVLVCGVGCWVCCAVFWFGIC